MTENNLYKSPESDVLEKIEADSDVKSVAIGQKLVIYAVLLYFLAIFAKLILGPFVIIVALVSLIMSLVGLYKVLYGIDIHFVFKILLFILLFVPLVNILILLRVNSMATKKLVSAGYKVGLLGAKG